MIRLGVSVDVCVTLDNLVTHVSAVVRDVYVEKTDIVLKLNLVL